MTLAQVGGLLVSSVHSKVTNPSPTESVPGRDEEELRKSLSELADPNPKSIKRISSCSNPFLDFSQDASIATYKHGLLVRKIHADPDCKKSRCLKSPQWGCWDKRASVGSVKPVGSVIGVTT